MRGQGPGAPHTTETAGDSIPPRLRRGSLDRWHGYACDKDAIAGVVFGRVSGDDADTRCIGGAASTPAWIGSLRDCIPNVAQASRWHGSAQPRPHWRRLAG